MNIEKVLQEITNIEKQLQQLKETLIAEEKKDPYKAVVYCHLLPNNKYYIGSTKNTDKRWNSGNGYKSNKEFYKDIKKYGWENIEHLILYQCTDINKAKSLESFLISLYSACKYGYNKTKFIPIEYTQECKERQETLLIFHNKIKRDNTKPNYEAIKKLDKIYKERS